MLAIELALGALRRKAGPISEEGWTLGLMLVVLTVNVALGTWENAWAKRLDSD